MGLNHAEVSKDIDALAQNSFLGNGTRNKDFLLSSLCLEKGTGASLVWKLF